MRLEKRELIEVDLILWKILLRFSRNEFFSRNFLFKGGSCLINSYLDYYRFSEDLDFTWKDQSIFEGKSKKQQKKCLSKLINKLSSIINDICKELSFDFKNDKNDKRYIEYGSNKKMLTFKLYFNSEVLSRLFLNSLHEI